MKTIKKFQLSFAVVLFIFSFNLVGITKTEAGDPTFEWALQLVGQSGGYNWPGSPQSITKDIYGNIYVMGTFSGTVDFDPSEEIVSLTSAGSGDIFILKLNSYGEYVWAKSVGGTGGDGGNSLFLDSSGNLYLTGWFRSTADFDPGVGTANLTSTGDYDIFILKLNSSGEYIWAKSVGGTGEDYGFSLSLDSSGNLYITGSFQEIVDFDSGTETFNLTSAGGYDIFILKLNGAGEYVWAKSVGGGGE